MKRALLFVTLLVTSLLSITAPAQAAAPVCQTAFATAGYPPGWTQVSSIPDQFSQTNGVVNTAEMLYVSGGPLIAIGGSFTTVTAPGKAAVPAKNLAILRASDGVVVWAAQSMSGWPLTIRAINGVIYVGGAFTAINGVPRRGIAAFNAYTYALLPWAPVMDGPTVRDIEISNAGIAYVASDYSVSAYRLSTGARTWRAVATLGSVRSLLLSPDQTGLFVGGLFSTLAGAPRNQLAEIYPIDSGQVYLPFAPQLRPNSIPGSSTAAGHDGQDVLEMRWDNETHLIVGWGGAITNGVGSFAPWDGGVFWQNLTEGDTQALVVLGNTVLSGFHRSHGNATTGCPFVYMATQWADQNFTDFVLPWDPGLNNGAAGVPTSGSYVTKVNGGIQDYLLDLQNRKVYAVGDFTGYGGTCDYSGTTIAPVPCTGSTPLRGIARYSF